MKHAWLVFLAACGGPSGSGDDTVAPDAAGEGADGSVDAMPPAHIGGWRMRAGDSTLSYRSSTPGPTGTATLDVFHQNLASDEFAGLGHPVVDEAGNLYLISTVPQQPAELLSLSAAGTMRWKTTLETGWSTGPLALGPDGNVYAHADKSTMSGSTYTYQSKVFVWDAETGAPITATPAVDGLGGILLPPDGSVYGMTYTEEAGYGLYAKSSLGAAPRWTKAEGGDAYALSPAGDMLVTITVPKTGPHEVVAFEPQTGAEKWRYPVDAALVSSPTLAIDSDGTIYVALSKRGSDLTVVRLSKAGAVEWTHVEPSITYPSRILVGRDTITIAAQTPNYGYAGVVLTKVTGARPAGATTPCGEPQAVDSADVIYWSCDSGIKATTPLGASVGSWTGRFTFQIVLGPDGSAYDVPAAYFADHQLFRIK
ncbi:MAG: PQQ-binding-like beta-propeller repeat protein [Kofleriaceae bacterium]|nr:PQQ-binding-like beta-propeller repeat protein [Kofleriaceae bacterium]